MEGSLEKGLVLRCFKLLHILVLAMLFYLCWQGYYIPRLRLQLPAYGLAMGLMYLVLLVLMARTYQAFAVGMVRVSQVVYSQCLAVLVTAAVTYVIVTVSDMRFVNPLPLMGTVLVQALWCVLWSILANKLYFAFRKPLPAVIVYSDRRELKKLEDIRFFEAKFQVIAQVDTADHSRLWSALRDARVVFWTGGASAERDQVIQHCVANGLQCYMLPEAGDVLMTGATHMQMHSVPIMRLQRACPIPEFLALKRLFDIVVSLTALVIASPIMLLTALAIKITDKGPVFYKQVRLTKNGKRFRILKFRSMRVDAEKDGVARLAAENDDRITPVGKFIRAVRIDELPQLINVLKGDMSIVGPRPERPEIAAQYAKEIPAFDLRLQVKAGLTGYAQVYGRYNTEPQDKLAMDLMYINRISAVEDLRIMFATVKVLLLPESTEGIQAGATTAMGRENREESVKLEYEAVGK